MQLQKTAGAATYIGECCDVLMGLYHEEVTACRDQELDDRQDDV